MSKIKVLPMNPETEIDRPGIAKLSGAYISRVVAVVQRDKWQFPKPVRKSNTGHLLYNLADVSAWLETNDLKSMVFVAEDRAPSRYLSKAPKGIGSAAMSALKIGIKPPKFKGCGTVIETVHVPERHDYVPPDPRLTRFSNNADHRISVSF